MEIINIVPKDIEIIMSFSVKEIFLLHKMLCMTELNYDSTIEEEKEAEEYLTKVLFPAIDKLKKKLEE